MSRSSVAGSRSSLIFAALLDEAEDRTRGNTGVTLVIAFNYGSRNELVRATRLIAEAVQAGQLDPCSINEHSLSAFVDTAGIPDPDLVIRTSGEQRLVEFPAVAGRLLQSSSFCLASGRTLTVRHS